MTTVTINNNYTFSDYKGPISLDEEATYIGIPQDKPSNQQKFKKYNSLNNTDRIKLLAIVIFKTLLTIGIYLFSSYGRSQWKEAVFNKKDVVFCAETTLPAILYKVTVSNRELQSFVNQPTLLTNLSFYQQVASLPEMQSSRTYVATTPKAKKAPKVESLNLSFKKLKTVAHTIGDQPHLKTIDLGFNELVELPDSIGNLLLLEKLTLCNNKLKTLPDTMGLLSKMKLLKLAYNEFTTIPECLYRLPATCTVFLESNPLSVDTIKDMYIRSSAPDYKGPVFIITQSKTV
jgi:Leucine-rich repeat (LRR) protein